MSVVFEKPRFSVDQMTSATDAAKRFAEVRKRAKKEPQYITDHNVVDSVILSTTRLCTQSSRHTGSSNFSALQRSASPKGTPTPTAPASACTMP